MASYTVKELHTPFVKLREPQKGMFRELALRLTHIPSMRLPDWYQPFTIHFTNGGECEKLSGIKGWGMQSARAAGGKAPGPESAFEVREGWRCIAGAESGALQESRGEIIKCIVKG